MLNFKLYRSLPVLAALLVFQSAAAQSTPLCDQSNGTISTKPIESGAVIVLGELHGSLESPMFTRQLVCAELSLGRRVVVGLEADAEILSGLSLSKGASLAGTFRSFASQPFWNRPPESQDGRSSAAMWSLWVALIARQIEHGDVVVLPIQPSSQNVSIKKFVESVTEKDNSTGVVLVGSMHARLNNQRDLPMNLDHFARQVGKTIHVNTYSMLYSMGEVWVCGYVCGVKPVALTTRTVERKGLYSMTDERVEHVVSTLSSVLPFLKMFDGVYWVGPVTPSFPFVSDSAR